MMNSSLKLEESSGQLQHVAIDQLFGQGIDAANVKKLKDAGIVTCNGLMMQTLTGIEGLSEVDKISKAAVKLLANTCCSVPEVFCRIKAMLELLEGDILKMHDNFGCQSAENKDKQSEVLDKYKQSLLEKDERIEILKESIELIKNVAMKRMEELIYFKEEWEEQHGEFVEIETMYNQLLEEQRKEIVRLKEEIIELLTQSAENKDMQSKEPDKDKQIKEPDKDKQIKTLKGSIELIKSVLNTRSKELRDTKQDSEKQNREFVMIRTAYNQLLEDQHKENVQLKKEKVELQEEIMELQKEIMELKKEAVEKERDCEERIREEMKTELEDKDNEILSAKELIKTHTDQLNNVNKKIHKFKDENKKNKEAITVLKKENSNAKVVITNLNEENSNLKEENNNLKEENNNLKEEKNYLKEENNNLKEEIISRKESIPAIFHIRK